MGVDTYTLRTKTQNVELPGGEVVAANVLGYLCKSCDHDTFMLYPGEYGYKRAVGLNATIERTQERFYGKGPVYFIGEDAGQGYPVYRAEDAEKVALQYDCDDPAKIEGVTLVGKVGERVRRGRRLVWTIMTPEQEESFEEECRRRIEEGARRWKEQQAREAQAREERRQREAREASLNSAGL